MRAGNGAAKAGNGAVSDSGAMSDSGEQAQGFFPLLRRVGKVALPLLLLVPVVPLLGIAVAAGGDTAPAAVSEPEPLPGGGRLHAAQAHQPVGARSVGFLQLAPDIPAGSAPPHGPRGNCSGCHRVVSARRVAAWPVPAPAYVPAQPAPTPAPARPPLVTTPAPPAAPSLTMLPFQEAHWQGLELIALTKRIGAVLKIPPQASGVVIDEATMPADVQGFKAGDLVTAVAGTPTPNLESFIAAANRVRDQRRVTMSVQRNGRRHRLALAALGQRLGTANGETAPMIRSGARSPHGDMGPCTSCHRIGSGNNLAVDLGDPLVKTAPAIRAGQIRPHNDRGRCSACHTIR